MADEVKVQTIKKREGLFGGSLFLKVIFIIGVALIAFTFIFGFVLHAFDPAAMIFWIIAILVGLVFCWLALRGILSLIEPKPFSPTDDWKRKLIHIARKAKPPNLYDLWLRGEDMHMRAKYGKILGLGFIPYITASPKRDENGNIIYKKTKEGKQIFVPKRNLKGEIEYSDESKKKPILVPVPEMNTITHKDGDTLFIVNKHWGLYGLINPEIEMIRANPKYHSDLVGDVYVKDVNFSNYGDFLYPSKQWQETIIEIMQENQSESIIQTHANWLDLVSFATHMSIGGDPTFQKIMIAQSEKITPPNPLQ